MLRFPTTLAILASFVLVAPGTAQTVELRYNFTEGMDLLYETVQETRTLMPQGMGSIEQSQTQRLRMQVLSVDADGNARIRNTVQSVQMQIQSPMGVQSFDSEEGSTDPTFAPLQALIGAETEFVIGADGRLTESGGVEAALEEMMAEMSPEERATFEQTFTPEALENMVAQSFQHMPDGPVSPGESWEGSFDIPFPFGTMVTRFVYTLERVADGVAHIEVTGSISTVEADEDNPMAGMVDFTGGEITGSTEFDLERGIVIASTNRTEIEMAMMGETLTSVTEIEFRLLP